MSVRACCLLLAFLLAAESSIIEFPSKKDRNTFNNHGVDVPLADILADIASHRNKRASGDPTYSKSDLQDGNNYGLVHYSGGNSNTIIVLTYKLSGGSVTTWNVYLSNDYGNTFAKINSRIGTGITLASRIFVSPENPKKIYFADANSAKIYLSVDEGVTFNPRTFSPSTIRPLTLLVNPEVDDWVLARSSENKLYVSRDLGETPFTHIADSVYSQSDFQWGAASTDPDEPYDQDRSKVYYNTDDPSDSTSEVHLYVQRNPYSDGTRTELDSDLGPHDAFLLLGRYIFVQKTIDGKRTLWVSVDRKPFKQAKIPTPYNHQQYIVGNINGLQAIVIIQHNSSYYNLYMSEENGELYYLALSDVVVEQSGGLAIDIEPIASMGYTTYVANQNVRDWSGDSDPSLRTLISFDAGANWEVIRAPTDEDSECILPTCSLHLHMSTSEYWRTGVYSQESAPGIIIAHGATGQYLNDDNTNLFISRDGGVSWYQTLSGTWGVSVLDYGGLIVAARDYHSGASASRTLKYTCDEGITWSDLTFTLQNLYVYGVISEPGEATTVVSLYGFQSNGWTVVTVDFGPIFPRDCTLGDFYNWTPFDLVTETGCLLGTRKVIQRRFPSHCCLTGVNYTRTLSESQCPCNSEDFECDYGYKHANGISGPCVRDSDITLPQTCLDGDVSFMHSQGYHKIGGDKCSGGVEDFYLAYEAPCCQNSVIGSSVFTSTITKHITDPPITSTVTSVSVSTTTSTSVSTKVSISTVLVNSPQASTNPRPPSASGLNSSDSSSSLTMPIILGVILGICMIVIMMFVIVGVVILVIKKMKRNSGNGRGYSSVPISYRSSNRESESPPPAYNRGGVSNVNFQEDNDDDDQPLPL